MNSKQFFYELGKAIYRLDAAYNSFAKESAVAPSLMWILYAINDDKEHTQIEICKDWDLPKSTVNTIIKELEEQGYINLYPIKGKRREMSIVISESGKIYANKLLSKLYEVESRIYDSLDNNDYKLYQSLNKISTLLNEKNNK